MAGVGLVVRVPEEPKRRPRLRLRVSLPRKHGAPDFRTIGVTDRGMFELAEHHRFKQVNSIAMPSYHRPQSRVDRISQRAE